MRSSPTSGGIVWSAVVELQTYGKGYRLRFPFRATWSGNGRWGWVPTPQEVVLAFMGAFRRRTGRTLRQPSAGHRPDPDPGRSGRLRTPLSPQRPIRVGESPPHPVRRGVPTSRCFVPLSCLFRASPEIRPEDLSPSH